MGKRKNRSASTVARNRGSSTSKQGGAKSARSGGQNQPNRKQESSVKESRNSSSSDSAQKPPDVPQDDLIARLLGRFANSPPRKYPIVVIALATVWVGLLVYLTIVAFNG